MVESVLLTIFFELLQTDEVQSTIKKHPNIYYKEISTVINIYLEYIAIKRKERQSVFISDEVANCRIWHKNEIDEFIYEKHQELPISKDLQEIDKSDLLVSYDFNSLYQSAQAEKNSTRPSNETAYLLKKYMNDAFCGTFNSGR